MTHRINLIQILFCKLYFLFAFTFSRGRSKHQTSLLAGSVLLTMRHYTISFYLELSKVQYLKGLFPTAHSILIHIHIPLKLINHSFVYSSNALFNVIKTFSGKGKRSVNETHRKIVTFYSAFDSCSLTRSSNRIYVLCWVW